MSPKVPRRSTGRQLVEPEPAIGWPHWTASLAAACREYVRPHHTPSMTTDDELCFLESYARWSFTGAGSIIDLGCWLGATTMSLAHGLFRNTIASQRRVVHGMDRFVWEPWMDDVTARMGIQLPYRPGQSFYDDVKRHVEPYGSLIRLTEADLETYEPPDEPVEFLFVDAMKSWELADQIAHAFFPLLIPGRSLVAQQDFAYHAPIGATAHLMMWQLRDAFQFVHHVPRSCSVVYACVKPLAASNIPRFDPREFTAAMIDEAFTYSLACVPREWWSSVLACKIAFLLERRRGGAAVDEANDLTARGLRLPPHVAAEILAVAEQRAPTVIEALRTALKAHGT